LIKHSQRWAPWVAVAVLVAGVVAYGVTKLSDSTPAAALPHRVAPLAAAERTVAREFVDTAVARKHLDRAWEITAPELKQGMSLDEWKTGTIPVVPYPVEQAVAQLKVVSSFTDTAQLTVNFLPRAGTKVQPASFRLDLRNVDGRWLVSSWLPSAAIVPPKGK
jgi:hypothetical protein